MTKVEKIKQLEDTVRRLFIDAAGRNLWGWYTDCRVNGRHCKWCDGSWVFWEDEVHYPDCLIKKLKDLVFKENKTLKQLTAERDTTKKKLIEMVDKAFEKSKKLLEEEQDNDEPEPRPSGPGDNIYVYG